MSTTAGSTPSAAGSTRRPSTRALVMVGLLVSALLAAVVSFYASGHPDGLEYVAQSIGFGSTAQDSVVAGSPLADYAVADVDDARLSGGLAGLVGALVVGLVMAALVFGVRRVGAAPGTPADATSDA